MIEQEKLGISNEEKQGIISGYKTMIRTCKRAIDQIEKDEVTINEGLFFGYELEFEEQKSKYQLYCKLKKVDYDDVVG